MNSKESIHGVVNVNKPAGLTSRQVVDCLKRIYRVKKAGHAGTLDPDATGVLLICLGRATKLFDSLQIGRKEYIATLTLGITTDTLDASGKVLETREVGEISDEQIYEAFKKFLGEIEQSPPMYSAVKYKGERLYKLARKGIEIKERQPRHVTIYAIEILNIDLPEIKFRVECTKGTYIRVLAADVGKEIGYGACLSNLVRTKVSVFSIENAVLLEELESTPQKAMKAVHPVDEVLSKINESFGK